MKCTARLKTKALTTVDPMLANVEEGERNMPGARVLITGAAYDSETIATLGRAFYQAWAVIAPNFRSVLAIDAPRLKLASVILSLAAEGERDLEQLTAHAVRTVSVDWP